MKDLDPRQSRELMLTPTAAVDIAIANILPEVAIRAGIEGPLSTKTKRELLLYTDAVRKSVRQYGTKKGKKESEPPTKQEIEIARLGGVIVMTTNLTEKGFLTNSDDVEALTMSVIESGYSPASASTAAMNPRKYLGAESITPRQLGNVINVWGELNGDDYSERTAKALRTSYVDRIDPDGRSLRAFKSSGGDSIDKEARFDSPSLKLINEVLMSIGTNTENLVDDETINHVSDCLELRSFTVTPQLRSDPHNDMAPYERYKVRGLGRVTLNNAALSDETGFEHPEKFYDPDRFSLFDDPEIEDEWSLGAADAAEYVREHPSQ